MLGTKGTDITAELGTIMTEINQRHGTLLEWNDSYLNRYGLKINNE